MKYPRHLKDRRSILRYEEPRDRDLTEEDLFELQSLRDLEHNNFSGQVIVNQDTAGIQPASPYNVR